MKCQTKNGHVENVTCPLSIQLYNSCMGGVDRADQLCGYYHVWMKSHKFYWIVLLNLTCLHCSISFFLSPQQRHLLVCCTMNAFTLVKYLQPNTGSTIRQQVFKSFRLELAWGLIGNCNCSQRYALPPALHDAAHNFTSSPAKRRKSECGMTDGTALTLEGHFPVRVLQDVAATAGTSVEGDMILVGGVRGVGRCSVLSTGIHPQKAPRYPASSATTPSGCS